MYTRPPTRSTKNANTMGKTNKTTTTTNSALNNTPTNHLTSQGEGQPCAAEKTRATQAPPPRTQVLTGGMAQLIPDNVLSVLTGATGLQRPPETRRLATRCCFRFFFLFLLTSNSFSTEWSLATRFSSFSVFLLLPLQIPYLGPAQFPGVVEKID